MDNVIQFPSKPLQKKLEDSMESMRDSLSEMYEALEKIDKGYKTVQTQVHDMEDSYQLMMQMYIEEVGEDEVPLEWLDYCPWVGMERDPATGKIRISLIKPPEGKNEK